MTIDGTVTDILGYPTLFFSNDARSPAVSTPINAAVAGGILARSTRFSLNDVLSVYSADLGAHS